MKATFLAALLAALLTASSTRGEEKLSSARLEAAGQPIDIPGGFLGPAPFAGDIDGDGLDDLLVGHDDGRLRIFRNTGTRTEPKYGEPEFLKIDGQVAELPGGGLFRPQLVDLNGDGRLDLVAASNARVILWYRRTEQGAFAPAEPVKDAEGSAIALERPLNFQCVDWDADGDADLLILAAAPDGNGGEFRLIENRGSARAFAFAAPQALLSGETSLRAPQSEGCPFVADWNGDGKPDLLLGLRNGAVYFYENTGEKGTPRFGDPRVLDTPPVRRRVAGEERPKANADERGHGACLCVTDWNHDGKLDLLIGSTTDDFIKPDQVEAARQLDEARQEAVEALSDYRRVRALGRRLVDESQARQRELLQQQREKQGRRLDELNDRVAQVEKEAQPKRESHGYVWLLRR